MDLKWELGVLLECYSDKARKLDKYAFREMEQLKELYAQAILLNIKHGYGLFFPIDDFIDEVRGGGINNYDGFGELLDAEGNKLGYSRCNVKFLEDAKSNGAVYVAWFNK